MHDSSQLSERYANDDLICMLQGRLLCGMSCYPAVDLLEIQNRSIGICPCVPIDWRSLLTRGGVHNNTVMTACQCGRFAQAIRPGGHD